MLLAISLVGGSPGSVMLCDEFLVCYNAWAMKNNCSFNELLLWLEHNASTLVQATFSAPQDPSIETKKATIRPIFLKEKPHLQIVFFDKTKSITKNVAQNQIKDALTSLLETYENIFIRLS